jgi:hypothetical protein
MKSAQLATVKRQKPNAVQKAARKAIRDTINGSRSKSEPQQYTFNIDLTFVFNFF